MFQAGINIWVLTGDKEETAINIAVACNLVLPKEYMDHIIVNAHTAPSVEAMKTLFLSEIQVRSSLSVLLLILLFLTSLPALRQRSDCGGRQHLCAEAPRTDNRRPESDRRLGRHQSRRIEGAAARHQARKCDDCNILRILTLISVSGARPSWGVGYLPIRSEKWWI
jgi:magnesium-transporting ATPase (P-type)